jgi:taurine--2-oxoglutarate transaminase
VNFNRLHVVPPCNTGEDDMREGLQILGEALGEVDRFYTG